MLPPEDLRHGAIVDADGARLIAVADLPPGRVAEVRTDEYGILAVGLAGDEPFAVSNHCRHQFAKLGRGTVVAGCLECPWHRARYDVRDGTMVRGPQGRIFGLPPYSGAFKAATNAAAKLRVFPVVLRDGVIELSGEPA